MTTTAPSLPISATPPGQRSRLTGWRDEITFTARCPHGVPGQTWEAWRVDTHSGITCHCRCPR